jgi:6-phosphogluconolactonase
MNIHANVEPKAIFHISNTPIELAQAASDHFIQQAKDAIQARGLFSVALSGGSTPKAMFECLAVPKTAAQLDWEKICVFWGDERCVPPENADSNYRMASETLLEKIPIPPQNIYRISGEMEPGEGALLYEHLLRNHFWDKSYFDLILLGLGSDGHTASLFPGTAAIHEEQRWVIAHWIAKLATWRISLTAPIINLARQVTFLAAGENKAQVLAAVTQGPYQPEVLPSQIVQPTSGNLTWYIDSAAAKHLST